MRRRLSRSRRGPPGRALALAAIVAACAGDVAPAADEPLVIGFVGPADSSALDMWRGARLGADEVLHAAGLVGRSLEFQDATAADSTAARVAAQALLRAGATVLAGGADAASCRALARTADEAGALYLNTTCPADSLRDVPTRTTFHIQASDSMRAGGDVLWHGALERYGAGQLNERFRRRFGSAPGGDGWAGWLAAKIAWEASLAAGATDGAALVRALEQGTEFDGHKGQPLSFGADHQLRQPLFPPAEEGVPTAGPGVERGTRSVEGGEALRAALADGRALAFVSNEGSWDVSVVDVAVGAVIATLPVDARPRGIRASPGGARVFVALSDAAPLEESDADGIAELDLRSARVVARHRAGSDPEQFALSPDGGMLYAANEDAGTATIMRLGDGAVLGTLVVGIEPEGVAASPDGRWVYVTAETSNTVSVIDTRTRAIAATFLVEVRPRAAAFSPDSRRAWVSNEISGTLSVIDAGRHRVIRSIELDGGRAKPVGIAVSPDGSRVFVANGHAHTVSVIDAQSLREIAVIEVGRRPWGIDASRDGRHVYVANGGSNDLTVIDARALRVLGTVAVGDRPWGVAATH